MAERRSTRETRCTWSVEDDETLKGAVEKHGTKSWAVAESIYIGIQRVQNTEPTPPELLQKMCLTYRWSGIQKPPLDRDPSQRTERGVDRWAGEIMFNKIDGDR